ncbi:hypothetical protein B0A55_00377 [Friedmanniomyces simplex]|uniref:Xylanolytic transcriptional activator regulatory domain-containing protein n=1 Tax=Friedmanniomyces simplex TaxID=329884 RepID=A0A4U0Y4W3_9PEZI|nr:hypothetical protein B0A55_00377 [Friedmanniomyces simplex]
MSAASEAQQPAKPGTACLGCRRQVGVKRKRGPYKKERHLEHLVKYLEPRGLGLATSESKRRQNGSAGPEVRTQDAIAVSNPGMVSPDGHGSQSETLVKDALIALTKSSVCEMDSTRESGPQMVSGHSNAQTGALDESTSIYPSARQVFEYWHLFVTRVDPITKVIHCPSVAQKALEAIDRPSLPGSSTETLLFAIYYVAVSTCTANEARRRFGEIRHVLLQRYGRVVESALADTYSMPTLESVQAVVLYMIGIRRQDDGTSVATLFALAVRMAQMIGLHEDPGVGFGPFEAELRRRAWWHICGLESRAAEEGNARAKSIQEGRNVRLPANLNDEDLDPNATEAPQTRTGRTDMSWVLMRWEVQYLTYRIAAVRKLVGSDGQPPGKETTTARQRHILEEAQTRLDTVYVQHLHKSRPLDLMALAHYECILLKVKMTIDCPNAHGQISTNSIDMSSKERSRILQDSVAIISITHMIPVDRRLEKWQWFIRGYVQWHSLAIVVAELGRIKNKQFTHSAWVVLDPILTDWDRMYLNRKGEAAWDHVNALISRARQMRHDLAPSAAQSGWDPAIRRDLDSLTSVSASDCVDSAEKQMPFGATGSQPNPNSTLGADGTPQQQTLWDQSADWEYSADFGNFDGLDQIDFQAFDAVFGGDAWEFPSRGQDFSGMPLAPKLHTDAAVC